jgi:hypothetical protein
MALIREQMLMAHRTAVRDALVLEMVAEVAVDD